MKKMRYLVLFLALAAAAPAVLADWTDVFRPYRGPKYDVVTLVVIGNYNQPKLLTELMQTSNRQPYILVPAVQDLDQEVVYFCPARPGKKALAVKKADFARFVKFVNPKQVIILGDSSYVPQEFVDAIDPTIPRYVLTGDWNRVADSLGTQLNLKNIGNDFRRISREIEEQTPLYIPEKLPLETTETDVTRTVEVTRTGTSTRPPEVNVTTVDMNVDVRSNVAVESPEEEVAD